MIIPYNVDIQMPRVPIANWVLIGCTCIASLVFLADPEAHASMMLWRGDDFEPAQLFTHLFAHASVMHLIGNMVFLFVFGNAVNARLGHIIYLLSYIVMGALAGLAWLGVDQGQASLGASGAIMGVTGIFIVYYPRNDVSVFFWIFRAGTTSFSSYFLIVAYVAFDLLAVAGKNQDGVAHMSHLGGAAAGFVLGTTFVLTGLVKPGDGEQTIFQALKGRPKRDNRRSAPRGATPFRPPSEPARPARSGPPTPAHPRTPAPPPGGWR